MHRRSWVASFGADANPCTRDLPCRTFDGAFLKTTINGAISCVDAGAFLLLSINKSITVDCHGFASIDASSGSNAIIISIPSGNPNDPLRTVRLRGLRISGDFLGRSGARGIVINSALHVFIDDVQITEETLEGILDQRDGSGNLYIKNSTIRDNGGTGIAVVPRAGTVDAVIDNSHVNRNNFGLSAGNNSRVIVNNSVFMGNAVQGVHADGGGKLSTDRSVISGNVTGVGADGGATMVLANTDIMFNGTGISGTTFSFSNNRILLNGLAGTPPSPIGGATHDTGQQ
jgi:hypothetical protein